MLLFFDGTPNDSNVLICGNVRRSELRRYLCGDGDIIAAGTCRPPNIRNWQDVQADDRAFWPFALPDLVRRALSDDRLNGAPARRVWMDVERQPMLPADAMGRSGGIAECQRQLNELISRHNCDLICAYDPPRWNAAELLEIVSFHPNVLNDHRAESNPFFGRTAQWTHRGDSWSHLLQRDGGEISSILLENCTDFIGIAGLDGTPQYVNPAGLRLVGLDNADEVRRLSVLDFIPAEDRSTVRDEYWRTVTEKGRWRGEIRFRHFKSGKAIPLLMDWFRIDDQRTGKPVVMATVSRDLTQQKLVEAELRMLNDGLEKEVASRTQALSEANWNLRRVAVERSQAGARLKELQAELFHAGRLSAMGQIAGTLAHELGQPLGAAINYINTARRSFESRGDRVDTVRAAMDDAAGVLLRAGRVLQRLRDFVAGVEPERYSESVPDLIEEALSLALIGPATAGVCVSSTVEPGLPPVLVDRIQIQQVLFNLIRNAIEAMVSSEPRVLSLTAALFNKGSLKISIGDSGPGISYDVAVRLFQPFLTTKRHGMGLGLSICRSIVEAHGGRLWPEDQPSGGTIFHFTVPVAIRDDDVA
jgi:PAS domain S-box-containing protein